MIVWNQRVKEKYKKQSKYLNCSRKAIFRYVTAGTYKHLRQKSAFLVKIIYYYYLYQNYKKLSQMLIFYVVIYLLLLPTKIGIFGKDNNIYILSLPKYQEYGGKQLIFLSSLPGHWLLYRGEAPMGRPLPLSGRGEVLIGN